MIIHIMVLLIVSSLVVNSRTAYKNKEQQFIMKPWLMFGQYALRGWFVLDVFTSIPFATFLEDGSLTERVP